jgi:hypothetical protein
MASDSAPNITSNKIPNGFRGWLAVMEVFLVVSAIWNAIKAISLNTDLGNLRFHGYLDEGSPLALAFHIEFITSLVQFILLLPLSVLFFRRSRLFPMCMVAFLVLQIGLSVVDYMAASAATKSMLGAVTTAAFMADAQIATFPADFGPRGLIFGFLIAAGWTIYLRRSLRAKATFAR